MDDDILCKFRDILSSCQTGSDAIAEHPTQAALGLRAITVKLAQLVSDEDQRIAANNGSWSEISFTAMQERQFATLQIQMNSYLNNISLPRIPLLHLSARMLLLNQLPTGDSEEGELAVSVTTVKSKHKKPKKRRKPQLKTADTVSNDCVCIRNTDSQEPCPSVDCNERMESKIKLESLVDTASLEVATNDEAPTCTGFEAPSRHSYSISKDKYNTLCSSLRHVDDKACIDHCCAAYEEILQRMREQHDTILQSLNMRLFIAQTEIENLKDQMLLRAQIDALP